MKKVLISLLIIFFQQVQTYSQNDDTASQKDTRSFGIGISSQNNKINWEKLKNDKIIKFVLINCNQKGFFKKRSEEAKKNGFIIGAFYYFDPNQDSEKQAKEFISNVKLLDTGDIVPIVNIEKISEKYPVDSLNNLIREFESMLLSLEKNYNKKPIISTSYGFYYRYLQNGYFNNYKFCISEYYSRKKPEKSSTEDAPINQNLEKRKIYGVCGSVTWNKAILSEILMK